MTHNYDYNFSDDDPAADFQQFESTTLETSAQSGRNTPLKYNTPHCIARFSPTGHLVKVSCMF